MIWLVCKVSGGHRWRTHRWGKEMAFHECRRFFCKATRKSAWYRTYQEVCGFGCPPPKIDGPYKDEPVG